MAAAATGRVERNRALLRFAFTVTTTFVASEWAGWYPTFLPPIAPCAPEIEMGFTVAVTCGNTGKAVIRIAANLTLVSNRDMRRRARASRS